MTRQDEFKDRLLFTLLTGAAVTVVAQLARHAVSKAWLEITGRKPPRELGIIAPAGRKAGEGAASFLAERFGLLKRHRV